VSPSITRRLLAGNLLALTAFLGLAGIALDRAFRSSVETAARDELQAHVYTLLTAADADAAGRMRLPERLAAPAFNTPDSGLYAEVRGEDGAYRWRSGSLIGRDLSQAPSIGAGVTRLRSVGGLLLLDQGIAWEDDAGRALPYTLTVGRDRAPLEDQQAAFRATLWQWLGGVALVLLGVLLALVRWGLRPLRAMSDAVKSLESGQATRIEGPMARELEGLGENLNALIAQNAGRQARVRHSLADLAHSMKTPLAVLRAGAEGPDRDRLPGIIDEQTRRIDQIVTYQRQRAAVAGRSAIGRPVALQPIIERLCSSLAKVHRERRIGYEIDLPDACRLRADEGDLFELLGNLLENAFRHASGRIVVSGRLADSRFILDVDDDGPGIAAADAQRLLRRGERADQRHPGDGIGLAVVNEIARQYGGEVHIESADLGGARLRVAIDLDAGGDR
jgi:two-component system sensor histidine kinase PhoQ